MMEKKKDRKEGEVGAMGGTAGGWEVGGGMEKQKITPKWVFSAAALGGVFTYCRQTDE